MKDPDPRSLKYLDPEHCSRYKLAKAPDPGSGSATLSNRQG